MCLFATVRELTEILLPNLHSVAKIEPFRQISGHAVLELDKRVFCRVNAEDFRGNIHRQRLVGGNVVDESCGRVTWDRFEDIVLAGLVRRFCPSHAIENPKVFFQILFNYVFANGDAHLKNFSLYESRQGDYILTPAYDLLNTSLHFPNEPTATGLDFFMDGHYTARYEVLGFYSSADFHELAGFYGVSSLEVDEMLSVFARKCVQVEESVKTSRLSLEAKSLYLAKFHDRLKALAQ